MKGWFIGPTYQTRPRLIAPGQFLMPDRTINLLPETAPDGDQQLALRTVPGLRSFGTLPDRPGRAIVEQDGRCFAVAGTKLCEIAANGSVTTLGSVAAGGDPAGLASNGKRGNQLMTVSGGLGYIFNTSTNTFTQISDGSFPIGAINCAYIDGFFIANTFDRFALSALLDGLVWNGDVGQRAGAPGDLINMIADHELLWLKGATQTEIWQDTGGSFPFSPISGAFLEQGLAAPWALAQFVDVIAWLGQDRTGARVVNVVQGYSPQPVSSPAIETMLASYTSVADARMFAYQMDGHRCLVLTIPSQRATWVYDATLQAWHEWLYWNQQTGQYEASRVNCHAYAFGKHLGLDRETGAIHELTFDVYDNAGEPIRWARRAPAPGNEGKTVFDSRLELQYQAGTGLTIGQGSDPQVTLRYSDDFAATWGNELRRSMGARGKYLSRVEWQALGSRRDGRVYEISGSEPIPTFLTGAVLDAMPGTH